MHMCLCLCRCLCLCLCLCLYVLLGAVCSPQAAAGIGLVIVASLLYHAEESKQSDSYARLPEGRDQPLDATVADGAADEPMQEQRQLLATLGGTPGVAAQDRPGAYT